MKDDNKGKYTPEQLKLITSDFSNGATPMELDKLLYLSEKFNLDIIAGQIFCIKKGTNKAQIYAGRDGFLQIAHDSKQFNGMETGTNGSIKGGDLTGWCKVYRKDMEHYFYQEVDLCEYTSSYGIWNTKPKTMIIKVAQSQCLRQAFNVSGIYGTEEMDQYNKELDDKEIVKNKGKKKIVKVKDPIVLEPEIEAPEYKEPVFEPMSKDQKGKLRALAKEKGFESNQEIKDYAFNEFKVLDLNGISSDLCDEIIEKLKTEKKVTRTEQIDFDFYNGSPLEISESERHRLQK